MLLHSQVGKAGEGDSGGPLGGKPSELASSLVSLSIHLPRALGSGGTGNAFLGWPWCVPRDGDAGAESEGLPDACHP